MRTMVAWDPGIRKLERQEESCMSGSCLVRGGLRLRRGRRGGGLRSGLSESVGSGIGKE
jgi:hypothetical protein